MCIALASRGISCGKTGIPPMVSGSVARLGLEVCFPILFGKLTTRVAHGRIRELDDSDA